MQSFRKALALLTPGLLLTGCNMAPHMPRPALPVPPDAQALVAAGMGAKLPQTVLAAGAQETPPVSWQTFFTDPRLRAVITMALAKNQDLILAVARMEQARAQYHVQGSDLFPTISANASGDIERVPTGLSGLSSGVQGASSRYNLYRAQLGVSAWEVDLFGRVRNLTRAAQETYFASAENRRAAQVSIVAEVARGWLQLSADREQLHIARETAETFAQTLAITKARAAMGVSSDLDVHQAETTYQQAQADVARLITATAQDRNALDLLAGDHVDDALLPAGQDPQPQMLANLPGGLSSNVLLKRPDVLASEHQLLAANANIGATRAAFFPNISLTAAFGSMSLGLSNLFQDGSQAWSVQPSISLPILDEGRNAASLHYAKATRDAMLATYRKTVQTAFREVADALARRATIDDQLGAQKQRAAAAQAALAISRARYQEGVDPFLTTLDSERSAYTARQDVVTIRLEKQGNFVELFRALGGGLE